MAPPEPFKKPQVTVRKDYIPYEIKNRREWDPNYHGPMSDVDSDEDRHDGDVDTPSGPYVSGRPPMDCKSMRSISQHGGGRAPALTLKTDLNSKGKATPKRQEQSKIPFDFKPDNLAKAAFRKQQPCQSVFCLPKDCSEIKPNRARMYDMLEEIGVRLESFIRPPQHDKDRELQIWGNKLSVRNTIAELQSWVNPVRSQRELKPSAKDKFSSEMSTTGTKYKDIRKKMLRDAAVQRFQLVPSPRENFAYDGVFLWPTDEIRTEEVLGASLEAFDPIRFQLQCHIVFDNKLSAFKVSTSEPQSVQKAFERFEGTMKEYIARNNRRAVEYLVEVQEMSSLLTDVKVLPSTSPNTDGIMIPVKAGKSLTLGSRSIWLEQVERIKLQNNRRLEQALERVVPNLQFHRGQVRIRVHFGTFGLTLFCWPKDADSIPLETFVNNVAKPGSKGILIRDLQTKIDAATIVARTNSSISIFQPLSNSIFKLEDVPASFSARFTFQNAESVPMQFTFDMSAESSDDAIYEKTASLWTRLDRGENATPLEVYMANLEDGASWKLQASVGNAVDPSRITPKMRAFEHSVRLKKEAPRAGVELTGQKAFKWQKSLPGVMQPSTFEQKTSFRFRLVHNMDYIFEISRYDTYGDPQDENKSVQATWAATLWNTEWDSILAVNIGLGIGQSASWNPRISTFFQPGKDVDRSQDVDPGVLELVKTIGIITRFLDGLKQDSSDQHEWNDFEYRTQ